MCIAVACEAPSVENVCDGMLTIEPSVAMLDACAAAATL